MSAKNQISAITLSEEQQDELVRQLNEMIEEGESYHCTWEILHNQYLRQYLCEPDQAVKSFPWEKASNLRLPLGRVIQDAIQSQLHDAMFANDPAMKVIGMEGGDVANAELLTIFYGDYVWKQLMPLLSWGNNWNFNTLLDGTAGVLPYWTRNANLKRNRVIEIVPSTNGENEERIVEEVTVERNERPDIATLDMTRFYPAPDTGLACNPGESLQYPNCRWYFIKSDLTPEDCMERKFNRGYANVTPELMATMGGRFLTLQERTALLNEQLSTAVTEKTTPLYEFYCRRVLPGRYQLKIEDKNQEKTQGFDDPDGFSEEIVISFWEKTNKIARIVPLQRLCPDGRRPHVCNWFNQIPGRLYGQGIQSKMRMLNSWMDTGANQMTDSGTIQNLPFFFYVPHLTGLMPDMAGIAPGQGIPVNDPRGVNIPRFQGDQSFWLEMMQFGQGWAERDGNVSDQTIGRMPEKAANKTARGMMMVQQMANIAFGRIAALMVQSYVDVFRAVHKLYQRHASTDVMFKVLGKRVKLSPDDFQQDLDFMFLIAPNRQAEQQTTQALYQLMMAIPYVQQNPASVRALARQVYNATGSAMGYRNFDEFWPEEMTAQIVKMEQQQIMQQAGAPNQPPGAPTQGPAPMGQPMMPGTPPGMPAAPSGMPQAPPMGPDLLQLGQSISDVLNRAPESDEEANVTLQ